LRLIDQDGNAAGVVKREDALARAREAGLDLVEIVPQSVPPVCRIIDFHKYKYEQEKKEREQRKKHRAVEQKEIRFSPVISEHDYNFKKEHIIKFLKEGDRVKVLVRFRGRQIVHSERGREILDRLTKELAEIAVVERNPRFEGGSIDIILRPV
jgi:translation initiation factor IF-3